LRYLRDEEGLFFQGCEVASASFYNSLRAFFLTSYTFKRTVWLQSNIFFFFLFSITIHLDLATCMHWETSGAGGEVIPLIAGQNWVRQSERHRKAKHGMAVFSPHRVKPSPC
jgi:hypothetical protein